MSASPRESGGARRARDRIQGRIRSGSHGGILGVGHSGILGGIPRGVPGGIRSTRPGAALLLVGVLGAAGLGACAGDAEGPGPRTLSVAATLADGDTAGYARAVEPRPFRFPEDHGPHPAYRHEWWYFTGNVTDGAGRPYGFQLTIFRSALRPDSVELGSPWATRQAYMAHFAVTDIDGKAFAAFERFERGALGLAGAGGSPLRVWVGDWEAVLEEPGTAGTGPVFRLRAREGGVGIGLRLVSTRAPVLQGDRGLSRKGPEPGNASYYYSLTRLEAEGSVRVDGEDRRVSGGAWLDREWGTSALGPDLAGWDWFAIQLDDAGELMYYRLRRSDGGTDRHSAGSVVDPGGAVRPLTSADVDLEATSWWTGDTGTRYPSGWSLRVPDEALELEVRPALEDQELDLAFRYWEGAVTVRGTRRGVPVTGRGYVELTGYDPATER